MEKINSRKLSRTWPYPRYNGFDRTVRKAAEEWFAKKGYKTQAKMPYCLASHDDWAQNILFEEVSAYIKDEQKRHLGDESFPLHKYLHHGLSSQAMVFNLIGPLKVRSDYYPLRTVLNRIGVPWPEGKIEIGFEYGDRDVFNEDSGQPTSIDLVISGQSTSLFIEAKFVEREFGGCSVFFNGDCEGQNPTGTTLSDCYLHHIGRLYWKRMHELGFLHSPMTSGPICPFASYYQFYREVLFSLHKGGKFILLHDERNPAFVRSSDGNSSQRGLWPFLAKAIPPQYQPAIGRITIQQVVQAIDESGRHIDWINEFKIKYGMG